MITITPDRRTTPLWWLNPWAYALTIHKALYATHQLYLETNEKLDRAEGDLHDAGLKIQELRHRVEVMASHYRKQEQTAKPVAKPKKRAKR
jgi:hypothetical protein